jgi:pyridoxamine 5'-phosphate oxidase
MIPGAMDVEDPIERLRALLASVRGKEPLDGVACALATADAQGRPSARQVLLKDVDGRGLTFFTNYGSRKAREMAANPYAAICLHWPSIEQQVRVEGRVERLDEAASDAYFATRPRDSQLGAWASQQSAPVASRDALEEAFTSVERRFAGGAVPRPPSWGGYRLVPSSMEFWIGRPHRLHDRFAYTRDGDGWQMARLCP